MRCTARQWNSVCEGWIIDITTYTAPLRDDPINALAGRQKAGLLHLRLLLHAIFFGQDSLASVLLNVASHLTCLLSFAAELITWCPGSQMVLGTVLDIAIALLFGCRLVAHLLEANSVFFNCMLAEIKATRCNYVLRSINKSSILSRLN